MLKSFCLVTSLLVLSSCSKSISGLKEAREKCISFGYKPASDGYTRCILAEEIRRTNQNAKENRLKNIDKSKIDAALNE